MYMSGWVRIRPHRLTYGLNSYFKIDGTRNVGTVRKKKIPRRNVDSERRKQRRTESPFRIGLSRSDPGPIHILY